MEEFLQQIGDAIIFYLPNVLLALGILIIGWLIAIALSSLVRRLLERTTLDDRLARTMGGDPSTRTDQIQIEKWISMAVFWLIMLITLVAFFQTLNIPAVSGPLNNFLGEIVAFLPGLLGALVLLALAWLIATLLRAIIVRVLNASGISRRLTEDADIQARDRINIGQTIGNVVYWLVFLLFLPAILDALNLQGLLQPVQGLVDDILGFLPNLLAAALILIVGWFVARIVRSIVTNLLAGLGIDRIGAQAGAPGTIQLSNVIGTILFVLILIPVAIAALNALDIPAVSGPAAEMLTDLLNALPAIFGAFVLLAIAYFVARLVGQFVTSILTNIGFDRFFDWIGIFRAPTPPPGAPIQPQSVEIPEGARPVPSARMTPSSLVGTLVTWAIILFAVMEAASLLGFESLTALVTAFIVAAVRILFGLVIFAIGYYLANWAYQAIRSSGGRDRQILALIARIAILVFSGALALRQMGIAESIVNLAFGLLLGALAVAAALAFGLGGRDVAARQLERWQRDLQGPPGSSMVTPPGATPKEDR